MLKKVACGLLISSFLFLISEAEMGFGRCDCSEEGFWSAERIMQCQRVSDFLIAVAYLSIPIELLYFVSCSSVPFKWVLVQFVAFIVLCGLTHMLNGWTYGPHPFQLMLALTVFKILTALVSFATAITLITLIPLLLKVKVRELMLKKKAWDLGREVRIIRKQKEAGLHVRMLTQEIRKSLDRHTILYTTLVELSNTLDLQNCAVWMPNEGKTELHLTHELKVRSGLSLSSASVPITEPDVMEIKQNDGVKILGPDSALTSASSGGAVEVGPAAGVRIPVLKVSNFKGGTPEFVPFCYAILVLVLPVEQGRYWSSQELDIICVVADQVAVALSHAAVLEESQHMRDQLVEQNQALQQAKQDAMMASQARLSFQKVMSNGMTKPMHSIVGLLSIMNDANLNSQQKTIVNTMVKTGDVLSTLINDMMEISTKDNGRFPLEVKSFGLQSTIKEAACLSKCLSLHRGYGFVVDVDKSMPDRVLGDERRVFQVILHMISSLLRENGRGRCVTLRVRKESGSHRMNDQPSAAWQAGSSDSYVTVKFEIGINDDTLERLIPSVNLIREHNNEAVEEGLSFSFCKKLVQLMQGNIWMVPKPEGFHRSMALVLRYQIRPSIFKGLSASSNSSSDLRPPLSLFRGLEVLLADNDDINRGVTKKLLQNLGCVVSAVGSGIEILGSLGPAFSQFQIVILDLHLPDLDGVDVATRIRKFRSRTWPLIVALMAHGDEDVIEQCFKSGMNGVIRKPAGLHRISSELRKVIQQANM